MTALTVHYDRAEPIPIITPAALDDLLDRLAADPRFQQFPVMVSLESADGSHVLEILIGRADLSILVWHRVFEEILTSKGTVAQPDDLAYNLGGSRTTAYRNSAVPTDTAREAARQFATTGSRPTVVDWQEPIVDEPAAGQP